MSQALFSANSTYITCDVGLTLLCTGICGKHKKRQKEQELREERKGEEKVTF